MRDFNANWERWCKIALVEHFKAGITSPTKFYVEGFARDTEGESEYVEFRLDGPYVRESAHGQWRLYFELNLLVVVQESNEDAYRINRITGIVSNLFNDCVDVYKKGPDSAGVDDTLLLGCLCLVPGRNERIQVSHFGKINPAVGIFQASVEGHYQLKVD